LDDSSLSLQVQTTTNLVDGLWTTAGIVSMTNDTGGTYDTVTNSVTILDPQAYIRLQITDE
jgi:hypothetical protein